VAGQGQVGSLPVEGQVEEQTAAGRTQHPDQVHRGDDLLLVAVADRSRTNLALADKAVATRAGTVLA
jgi:hypothetical protein